MLFRVIINGFVVASSILLLRLYAPWPPPISDVKQGDSIQPIKTDALLRRRPIKIQVDSTGNRLIVGNRKSGSISFIDRQNLKVIAEWRVAGELSDLVHWKDQLFLLADFQSHSIICLDLTDDKPTKLWDIKVPKFPFRLLVSNDRTQCLVAGLWSRRLCQFELPGDQTNSTLELIARRDLDFAPGHLVAAENGNTVLVFDAFGDRFSAFETGTLRQLQTADFSSRRIGGVARIPDSNRIVVTEQSLNRLAHAIRNDVHWGLMIANNFRLFDVEPLVAKPTKTVGEVSSIPIGGAGDAKGDPQFISLSTSGKSAISLSGVDQIAIGQLDRGGFAYVDVGRKPGANTFSNDETQLFVANELDDTISVIDVASFESVATISLGKSPPQTIVDRGERLFFDARLSHDGWMSCHSCHVDGHTTGFLNDNFSDQSFGAPKRVLSLLGHGQTEPFAWNGSAKTLEAQIKSSIEITMSSDAKPKDSQIEALTAFVKSLNPPPSLHVARENDNEKTARMGRLLFESLHCVDCHREKTFTSPETYDVGIHDELGNQQFNPPSLIGVSQRDRFFHDARATSLADVVGQHHHQLPRAISDSEKQQLMAYLNSL